MRPFLLLSVLVVLAGCSGAVRAVDPEAESPSSLRALAEREVRVHLADGGVRPARGLRVEADTTSWVDADTGALVAVRTASVVEVRHRDRWGWSNRVAVRSALVGGLAGTVLGAAALWEAGDSNGAAVFAVGGGAIATLYGLVGGAVAGAAVAPQDRYVLAPDSARGR